MGFVHVLKGTQLGIGRKEKPRCILWYGSGFGDYHVEWLDVAGVEEGTQIIHELESFEAETKANSESRVSYEEFLKEY